MPFGHGSNDVEGYNPWRMALYPERDKLDDVESRYVLVNLAARRAAQLTHDHAPALVEATGEHPLTTALLEIAEGAVVPVYDAPIAGETGSGYDVAEFGSSTPADSLDEAYDAMFGEEQMTEVAVEGDLGDFGGTPEEDRVTGDKDTISLSDLADEEESEDEADESEETGFGFFGIDEEEAESPEDES